MSGDIEVTLELRWWHGMGEETLGRQAEERGESKPDYHLTDGTPAWLVWFNNDELGLLPGFIVSGARLGRPASSVLVLAYGKRLEHPESPEVLRALLYRVPAEAWDKVWQQFGAKVKIFLLPIAGEQQ